MNIFRSNFRRVWTVAGAITMLMVFPVMAESVETSRNTSNKIDYTDVRINGLMVQQAIDEVWQKIEQEKKKGKLEMKAIQFVGFSNKVAFYAEHPDIEKETKVAKTWFTKIVGLLNDMYRSRKLMERSVLKKDRDAYNEAKTAYIDQLLKLEKLKNNPEKLEPSTRRRR